MRPPIVKPAARRLRTLGIPARLWAGVIVFALLVLAAIEVGEGTRMLENGHREPFIFRLAGYANLLLASAAVLYVAHSWLHSPTAGRLASFVATAGAAAALLALAVRWIETYYLQRPGHAPLGMLHEVTALFAALTVVIYLVMERVYRNRSAGAFVMLIVLAALLFEIWLLSHDHDPAIAASASLRHYALHAHVLASFVAYAAFAAAAVMAGAYLLQTSSPLQHAGLAERLSLGRGQMPAYGHLMHSSVVLGFAVFSLSALFGAAEAWVRGTLAFDAKAGWTLTVWSAYATYLWLDMYWNWNPRRLAWTALLAFAIAAGCLLGAHVAGVHFYG